jgi:hypothetical protein
MSEAPTLGEFPHNCYMTPQGIATAADWALMMPCLYGNVSQPPKVVFVHHLMLPHFVQHVLPKLAETDPFVLVTSGGDQTIPTGSGDMRFKPLAGFSETGDGGPNWETLTTHPRIIWWFCENHDLKHPKVSTLPVGVVEGVEGMQHVSTVTPSVGILKRPLQFLVAHRIRNGFGPWELRAKIQEACLLQQEEHLPSHVLCLSPKRHAPRDLRKGIPLAQYIKYAQSVSFVLCVKGGGLDPSPKAWEAIMLGTIPIIQHSTLDDAYAMLPVVFIDDWNKLFTGSVIPVRERLEELRLKLAPYYNNRTLRAMVVEVSS